MPNFKRVGPQSLTIVLNINSRLGARWLTDDALGTFVNVISSHPAAKSGSIFLSISFTNDFSEALYKKIEKHFSKLTMHLEVGLEISNRNIKSLFCSIPRANHTTLVFQNDPNWMTPILLKKAHLQLKPVTILQYVTLQNAENVLEAYRFWAKKFPRLEIVLHPSASEASKGNGQELMDIIKEEGYFEPENTNAFNFQKPEKLRINFAYSDVELSPREVKLRGLNRFKGMRCLAGEEHLLISETGEVFPSGCGHLPAISQSLGAFRFNSETYICPAESCSNSDDILITKIGSNRVEENHHP